MNIRTFALALAVTVGASVAQAATVKFTLDISTPGTFSLFAEELDGPADNGGIASYGVALTGNITALDHRSPQTPFATSANGNGVAGFTSLRSADGITTLLASQDTLAPTPNLIYGFGQVGGSFEALSISPVGGGDTDPWDAKLLLATGTYEGQIGFNEASVDTFANIFVGSSGSATAAADLEFLVDMGGTTTGPDLGPGGALDFGYNGQSQFITLTNTGDETANFLGGQFEITGANAGLFSLVNADFTPIAAGGSRQFEVLFNSGSNAQASYEAQLTFLTDAATNPSFLLTAQVPEPSTVALAGLGMVGLVGLARRRK